MNKTLIFLITAVFTVFNPTRKTITLAWDYPMDEVPAMTFNVYSITNLASTNWVLMTNVVAQTNVTLPVQPGNMFFMATASNWLGESIPSNVVTSTIARNITNTVIK